MPERARRRSWGQRDGNAGVQRVRRHSLRSASARRRKLHIRSCLLPFRMTPAYAGLSSGFGTEHAGAEQIETEGNDMEKSCALCARAFREEQPGGMTALRCGYRAGAAEQTPPRPDGIRMLQPSTCYGRIAQLFPTGMDGCADGTPPAWCRGYFIQKQH